MLALNNALLAQLVEVTVLETGGSGFESQVGHMSCFNFIPPGARESFFSDEAKTQRLSWFPPQLLITDRQAKRMENLAKSDKATDRIVAAGNPSTPLFVLTDLARDPDPLVRGWVARNPSVRKTTIEYLTGDPDPSIRAYAKFRLAEIKEDRK
jgi:hypothetical protein